MRFVLAIPLILLLIAAPAQAQPDPLASSIALGSPAATIMNCPAGDGDTFVSVGSGIVVQVNDVTGLPLSGLTNRDFEVDGFTPFAVSDALFTTFPPAFDVAPLLFFPVGPGTYRIDGPLFAGGNDNAGAIVKVLGVQIITGAPLAVQMTSPDIDGNGIVNIVDIGALAAGFTSGVYTWQIDFNGDGVIDIADIGKFAVHLSHGLPAGSVIDPLD